MNVQNIRFGVKVLDSGVLPVRVGVRVELMQVFELVLWVMLQIVDLYRNMSRIVLIISSSVGGGSSMNLSSSVSRVLKKGLGVTLATAPNTPHCPAIRDRVE